MLASKPVANLRRCCLTVLLAAFSFVTHAQTAADTARLAAASGYLETGGLKLGMHLKDIAPAARALNPLMKLTNTEKVTVWPTDTADYTKTAPPEAPVSVRTLELMTIQGATRTTNETVVLTLAMYPNAPVVIALKRTIQFPDGAGPNFAQILDAIHAKYGQATETQVLSDSANLRMRQLYWYFDRNGSLMPPIAPYSSSPCSANSAHCHDRSMFSLAISASGSNIVKSLDYQVHNGPLQLSAQHATDEYLQSVDDLRTQKQNDDSKSRPLPKL